MGGAGIRRGLRAPSGPSAAPAAPGFDRPDLGMLAGFDPDPLPYLATDGVNRIFLQTARWSYDLAGNPVSPYFVQQGVSTAQPLSEPAGLFGKPSIYYTTDDFLATADAVLANLLDGTQPHTLYAVIDRDNTTGLYAGNNVVTLGDSGSSAHSQLWGSASTDVDLMYRGLGGGGTVTGTIPLGVSPVRITASYAPGTATLWVGGNQSASASISSVTTCDRLYIGVQRFAASFTNYMYGRMGLILIYRIFHSAAQRAYVWGLLQSYYPGLP